MKLFRTVRFERNYAAAPRAVQKAFDKQSALLLENLRHPSLRAKKYDEANEVRQARVNRDWRFYFIIEEDAYLLINIIPHPK